jgi:hypothetical protein
MALAAIDRLVHHATIFEMNVESCPSATIKEAAPRKKLAKLETQDHLALATGGRFKL